MVFAADCSLRGGQFVLQKSDTNMSMGAARMHCIQNALSSETVKKRPMLM
jgi:hypothetical protein